MVAQQQWLHANISHLKRGKMHKAHETYFAALTETVKFGNAAKYYIHVNFLTFIKMI